MSKYKWYDLYKLLADKLFELYEKHENIRNSELKNNYEKGNEYFFKFLSSSQNKYFGEIIYDICEKKENFFSSFAWAKNISERSLDPFHIFVSFNYSNITLDKKIERLQFYFDIFEINVKVNEHEIENRYSVPHITPVKLLTNRSKKIQNDIWLFFSAIMKNNDIGIKKGFDEYENWYGIAFTVITEFLFWINSSKYISLDKNTEKLLLNYNTIDKIPKDYEKYIMLIKRKENNYSENIFRLIVAYSYNVNIEPENDIDKIHLFDFLNNYENRFSFYKSKTNLKHIKQNKFQLVALKVSDNEKNNDKFIKNLKLGQLYKFNQNFQFLENGKIEYLIKNEINLYDIPNNKINVNIVVGKNGSAKSTILELAFIIINNLFNSLEKEKKYVDKIYAELYFITDHLYKITIENEDITIDRFLEDKNSNDDYIFFSKDESYKKNNFNKDNLFYTQHINYSLHSLNSNYFGDFINQLFHKSDDYKTPILLEPSRYMGKIDINKEMQLMKDRLLYYILTNEQTNLKKLVNEKVVKTIELSIDYEKLLFDKPIELNYNEYNNIIKKIKVVFDIDFNLEITTREKLPDRHFCDFAAHQDERTRLTHLENEFSKMDIKILLIHYIVNKLRKMSKKEIFSNYKNLFDNKIFLHNENRFVSFLKLIKDNHNYKVTKIRRAIYSLIFLENLGYENIKNKSFDVNKLSELFENNILSKYIDKGITLTDLLPPSFFKVNLVLQDGGIFESLSSGEKQKIFIIYTILYHLKNINDENNYKYVNIVLDEIELYFHPEMQKDFISDLLSVISTDEYIKSNISFLNFSFITHSPFVLSDVTYNDVMALDGDGKQVKEIGYCFASNIYDLLNSNFFMKSFMGRFAETKIDQVIAIINIYKLIRNNLNADLNIDLQTKYKEFYNIEKKESLNEIKNRIEASSRKLLEIIEYIGEPVLRNKLLNEMNIILSKVDDKKINEILDSLKGKNYTQINEIISKLNKSTKKIIINKFFENM